MKINYFNILLIVGLGLVFSCQNPSKTTQEPHLPTISLEQPVDSSTTVDSLTEELSFLTQYQNRIDSQLALGINKDTIILGFRFGMTKHQVIKQMRKQRNARKVTRRKSAYNKFALVYRLPLRKYGKVDTYFHLYYDAGKLSKIDCHPQPPKGMAKEDLFMACVDVFKLKYGSAHLDEKEGDCPAHYWIEGNRQIKISCTSDKVKISYLDLKRQQKNLKIEHFIDPDDLEI